MGILNVSIYSPSSLHWTPVHSKTILWTFCPHVDVATRSCVRSSVERNNEDDDDDDDDGYIDGYGKNEGEEEGEGRTMTMRVTIIIIIKNCTLFECQRS